MTSNPTELSQIQIVKADAFEWLPSLPDASVDLFIADPPYESLNKHIAVGGTTVRLKRWFQTIPNSSFPELFSQIYRVLKNNSHFYFFCDAETAFIAKPVGEAAGFKFWKPLIWDKQRIGMGYHYRARYEMILFFEKGKRKLNNLGTPDILSVKRVVNGYPTEKPVGLSETLISQSTQPGELVANPFVGSGSTAVAARNLGRRFTGCDISEDSIATATRNLGGAI